MPVPTKRKTHSAARRRRSHDALSKQNVGMCQVCQVPVMPHCACRNCGSYKGKQVLDTKRDAKRVVKKAAKKEEKPTEEKVVKKSKKKAS